MINGPKFFFGRTIFVSNHPASFMDPLTIAVYGRPIIHFMVRADVFNGLLKIIFRSAHMMPIYRQQDGVDTKKKNEEVFEECSRLLTKGSNLLLFGEGFTDDIFIRRLKPVKKGAVRIGFSTLEKTNWSKKIYIAGVGCNYTDPNKLRSGFLLSYSDRICLNNYKDAYEENPNKVIAELTKLVEVKMQEQITHVEEKELAPLHEQLMTITRKGMNAHSFDPTISLEKRWRYSQSLAVWLNMSDKESSVIQQLSDGTKNYFNALKKNKVSDHQVYWKEGEKGGVGLLILQLILLLPVFLLGLIHCGIPYVLVKRFVEKSFKRKVFWGSVKMVMGKIAIGLFNIPIIFVIYYFIYPSWMLAIGYYFLIGLIGLGAYIWYNALNELREKQFVKGKDVSSLWKQRIELQKSIDEVFPDELK